MRNEVFDDQLNQRDGKNRPFKQTNLGRTHWVKTDVTSRNVDE